MSVSGNEYCAPAVFNGRDKIYLCAEFGESLFIQICLFIDSGFVPKLWTRRGYV